ncbi:hypothetical protein INR49_020753, partial [Caranx melampygus]
MADFLGNLVGNDGIAKMVGDKVGQCDGPPSAHCLSIRLTPGHKLSAVIGCRAEAPVNNTLTRVTGASGDVVEDTMNKVLSGKGGENKEEEKKKEGGGGGFDMGDVLSLAGGNKDKEQKGGVDVGNMGLDLLARFTMLNP